MTNENKITCWVMALVVVLLAMIRFTAVTVGRQNDDLRSQIEAHRLEIEVYRERLAAETPNEGAGATTARRGE